MKFDEKYQMGIIMLQSDLSFQKIYTEIRKVKFFSALDSIAFPNILSLDSKIVEQRMRVNRFFLGFISPKMNLDLEFLLKFAIYIKNFSCK